MVLENKEMKLGRKSDSSTASKVSLSVVCILCEFLVGCIAYAGDWWSLKSLWSTVWNGLCMGSGIAVFSMGVAVLCSAVFVIIALLVPICISICLRNIKKSTGFFSILASVVSSVTAITFAVQTVSSNSIELSSEGMGAYCLLLVFTVFTGTWAFIDNPMIYERLPMFFYVCVIFASLGAIFLISESSSNEMSYLSVGALGAFLFSVTGMIQWSLLDSKHGHTRMSQLSLFIWRRHLVSHLFDKQDIESVDSGSVEAWTADVQQELRHYVDNQKLGESTSLKEPVFYGGMVLSVTILQNFMGVYNSTYHKGINGIVVLISVLICSIYISIKKRYVIYLRKCVRKLDHAADEKTSATRIRVAAPL